MRLSVPVQPEKNLGKDIQSGLEPWKQNIPQDGKHDSRIELEKEMNRNLKEIKRRCFDEILGVKS